MISLKKLAPSVAALAITASAHAVTINLLTDDMEGYALGTLPLTLPTVFSPPPSLAGDRADIVTGPDGGVSPHGGNQMLKFRNTHNIDPFTQGRNGDLYYILDLAAYATSLAGGTGSVDVSAWFNNGAGADEFFLGLSAWDSTFSANPSDIRLITNTSFPASHLASFDNFNNRLSPTNWEQDSISMALPANTRFLSVRVASREITNINGVFESSFADDVSIDLQLPDGFIPNPNPNPPGVPASGSTLVFLSTSLVGLLFAGRRKSRRS